MTFSDTSLLIGRNGQALKPGLQISKSVPTQFTSENEYRIFDRIDSFRRYRDGDNLVTETILNIDLDFADFDDLCCRYFGTNRALVVFYSYLSHFEL